MKNLEKVANVNEEVRKEINDIIWSMGSNETPNETDKSADTPEVTETVETEKTETETEVTETVETEGTDTTENTETDAAETEGTDTKTTETEVTDTAETGDKEPKETEAEVTQRKKRDTSKFGDKEWASKISPEEVLDKNTILCFRPGSTNKIGNFISYGKKEGIIWLDMFKKNSFEHMSKPWSVKLSECEIVAQTKDGVETVNPKYVRDEKGYHLAADIKDDKKVSETAEVTNADETSATVNAEEVAVSK